MANSLFLQQYVEKTDSTAEDPFRMSDRIDIRPAFTEQMFMQTSPAGTFKPTSV